MLTAELNLNERPICKRCLLAEIDKDGLYKKVEDLIAAIPDDERASGQAYATRLDLCCRCPSLENGLCRECGCFVELRAAVKENRCPSVYRYWDKE
ncbi:MAG: DUF6171 family protein [Oscillospiraceae bacterium]|nr:DUF6171 family protein [Oscillospiraceae bacterium]